MKAHDTITEPSEEHSPLDFVSNTVTLGLPTGASVQEIMRAFNRHRVSVRPETSEAVKAFIPKYIHHDYWQDYLEDHALILTDICLAYEKKKWKTHVGFHQDEWKVYALNEAFVAGFSGKTYWVLLRETWEMLHNLYGQRRTWRELLMVRMNPGPKSAMSVSEKETFAALPPTLTLYRGARPDQVDGLSWTTDLEVAKFFAERTQGDVYVVKVPKSRVIMYLSGREESEVIIDTRKSDKPKRFRS